MVNNLIKINNQRLKLSAHNPNLDIQNIIKVENKFDFFKYVNNYKIININNFNLVISKKKIKYSTYYTNPFVLDRKILSEIKFKYNKSIYTDLLEKIFFNQSLINLLDKKKIHNIVCKKNFRDNYIGIEETFIIFWHIIQTDLYILNKEFYLNLLKSCYLKYINNLFDINDILNNIFYMDDFNLNSNNFNDTIKFYISLYVLIEEFHFNYLKKWLHLNNYFNKQMFNCNYTKINPQEIMNDCDGNFTYDKISLIEHIEIPFGHNFLLLYYNSKIYYYDSDQTELDELYKLKILFKTIGFNYFNISNRYPIQTITDDGNCLFYCLRFAKLVYESNIDLSLLNLKLMTSTFEKNIFNNSDMFDWICEFIS